jgi:hypothetical protein
VACGLPTGRRHARTMFENGRSDRDGFECRSLRQGNVRKEGFDRLVKSFPPASFQDPAPGVPLGQYQSRSSHFIAVVGKRMRRWRGNA